MSIDVIDRVLKHSKQRDSTRYVATILAYQADRNGHIHPDSGLVADLAHMTVRNVQLAIKLLCAAGELIPSPLGGYTLSPEKSRGEARRRPDGRIDLVAGDQVIADSIRSPDRRQRSADRNNDHLIVPLKAFKEDLKAFKDPLKREGEPKQNLHAAPEKESDARAGHPAIQAVREILHTFTGKPYYPNKVLWDDLIASLGPNPDCERLVDCFKLWVSKNNKPTNIAWALEWYLPGVLESKKVNHHETNSSKPINPKGVGRGGASSVSRRLED